MLCPKRGDSPAFLSDFASTRQQSLVHSTKRHTKNVSGISPSTHIQFIVLLSHKSKHNRILTNVIFVSLVFHYLTFCFDVRGKCLWSRDSLSRVDRKLLWTVLYLLYNAIESDFIFSAGERYRQHFRGHFVLQQLFQRRQHPRWVGSRALQRHTGEVQSQRELGIQTARRQGQRSGLSTTQG